MKRSLAVVLLVLATFLGACSGSTPAPLSTFSVGPQSQTPTNEPTPTEAASPSPPLATSRTPAPPPPPPASAPAPAPAPPRAPSGRNEPLGAPFSIRVGETVGIAGEDLVITYSQLLSDNRCPLGVQCIVAGNARIVVIAGTDSDAPRALTLNTDDGPSSAEYQDFNVELVSLSRGDSPTATLRVT